MPNLKYLQTYAYNIVYIYIRRLLSSALTLMNAMNLSINVSPNFEVCCMGREPTEVIATPPFFYAFFYVSNNTIHVINICILEMTFTIMNTLYIQ